MKEKITYNTASILENYVCKDCGWPIVDVCCNGSFREFKDAKKSDWWYYCSNKSCKNHDGQGVFQDEPEWIEIDNSKKQKKSVCSICKGEGETQQTDIDWDTCWKCGGTGQIDS